MALSEHEQRLLDEMERNLYSNEADFVSTSPSEGTAISGRSIMLVIIAAVVGLGVVVAGMAFGQPLIGILGFVAMIAMIAWTLQKNGAQPADGDEASATTNSAPPRSTPRTGVNGSSFMDRMEERWERRRDGEN